MKHILIISFTFLLYLDANAQSNSTQSFALRVYPQYIFMKGFRFDLEKSILNKVAVYAGPLIYSGLTNGNGDRNKKLPDPGQSKDPLRNNDKIKGYGLNAVFKFYFNTLEIKEDEGGEC
ncbi:MAG: hypothetical protein H7296_14265 [Bacteroidia bacterium]|nr:hypothetical protein [Bacteroidia bacterium]